MKSTTRLAGLASLAFALIGCGGNSGTQITGISRSLDFEAGTTYAGAAPVDTVGGAAVSPLASFTTKRSQQVVVWGVRDETTGRITGVQQMAYAAPGVAPLYAAYDATGGLASIYDTDTRSYVTFGPLEGSSIECVGYDGTKDKTATVRATLSDVGVTIEVLSTGRSVSEKQVVPLSELTPQASARTLPNGDPLAGLDGTFSEPAERTRIIKAIIKAAGLVVKAPFDGVLRNVSGFMLLDRFTESYGQYAINGFLPTAAASGAATPLPYRTDLP